MTREEIKTLLWVLIFFIGIPCFFMGVVSNAFATPSRLDDGKVKFAICTVGGKAAFTQAESDDLQAKDTSGEVVALTPESWEVNLSTCIPYTTAAGEKVLWFESYTDWLDCQTKKEALKKKLRKARAWIDSNSDLPASESAEMNQRFGYLKKFYLSLPIQ